jgi:hypothetical protein
MSRDDKGNEKLEVNFKSDGAGMREVYFLAKGRFAVFLVVFLSICGIFGYLWANGNEKLESMQIPEKRSFPGMNYRIYDIIKE